MPEYILAALFAISFVLPTVTALGAAVFAYGHVRWFVGAVGILVAVAFHVGLAAYSTNAFPGWWEGDSAAGLTVAYIFIGAIGNIFGIIGAIAVAEKVDEEPDNRRRHLHNVA